MIQHCRSLYSKNVYHHFLFDIIFFILIKIKKGAGEYSFVKWGTRYIIIYLFTIMAHIGIFIQK